VKPGPPCITNKIYVYLRSCYVSIIKPCCIYSQLSRRIKKVSVCLSVLPFVQLQLCILYRTNAAKSSIINQKLRSRGREESLSQTIPFILIEQLICIADVLDIETLHRTRLGMERWWECQKYAATDHRPADWDKAWKCLYTVQSTMRVTRL